MSNERVERVETPTYFWPKTADTPSVSEEKKLKKNICL